MFTIGILIHFYLQICSGAMNLDAISRGPRDAMDVTTNSGYGSGDETATLLVRTPSVTIVSGSPPAPTPSTKPVLTRQECTTYLLSSNPGQHLGGLGGSQESSTGTGPACYEENSARSVPDIELHCRMDGVTHHATGQGNLPPTHHIVPHRGPGLTAHAAGACRLRASSAAGYHLLPHAHSRCRCEQRRESHSPVLSLQRSVSRESVRSHSCTCCNATPCTCHGGSTTPAHASPSLLAANSPYSSARMIRQSSQPEPPACAGLHCLHMHHVHAPTSSLRQLREPGDGIAGIAADSLRINGAIRQFKQVSPISFTINNKIK